MSAAMELSNVKFGFSFLNNFVFVLLLIPLTVPQKIHRFGSKTPYDLAHPNAKKVVEDEYNSAQFGTYSCLASQATFILRHGSRYPGLDTTVDIDRIHDLIKGQISTDSFADLISWKNSFPHNNDKSIMDKGEEEHYGLGKRASTRLKTLFIEEDIENFRFLVSSSKRAQESAASFHEGFTEVIYGEVEDIDSELNDESLRFHDRCQKYIHTVNNNKTAIAEFYKFLVGKEMTTVLKKVNVQLRLENTILTTDDIRTIHLVCGYEMAIFNSSVWCNLLDDDDFHVLEYLSDLKHYYKNSHGHQITGLQSCPLVTDIFLGIDDAIDAIENEDAEEEDSDEVNGYYIGNFYFGHAETLGPLYALLGLFNDTIPPTADNYEQQSDRQFRSSDILSFSANLMFVLYECDQNHELLTEKEAADETRENALYMLKLFVNERPVKIPGCDDFGCEYEIVKKMFEKHIHCDFSKLCTYRAKDEL